MTDPLPRRILIPVDVAEFRHRAFRLGTHLAKLNDAEVLLLTVIDDRFPYPDMFSFQMPGEDFYWHVRERARKVLEDAMTEAPEGVRVRTMVARGKPWKVIVEIAEAEEADLIIMTAHTHRGLEHALLGSVAEKVLHHAPCPILIVPVGEAAGRDAAKTETQ